jgi:hypothetical protein
MGLDSLRIPFFYGRDGTKGSLRGMIGQQQKVR